MKPKLGLPVIDAILGVDRVAPVRAATLFLDYLEAFTAGREMKNVVDLEAGY